MAGLPGICSLGTEKKQSAERTVGVGSEFLHSSMGW